MQVQKIRWSKVYESTEEELTDFLHSRNITAERWVADESSSSGQRSQNHATTIWCAEGSLVVYTGSTTISLQPGDALRIHANVTFETIAGMSGCVCYESITTTSS